MAVLVEAISVVIRRSRLDASFPGGWKQFVRDCPNDTLCTDGELARLGFLAPDGVEEAVAWLERSGLVFLNDDGAVDFVVVDQLRGPTVPCDWLEFARFRHGGGRLSAAWLFEGPRFGAGVHLPGQPALEIATPPGWEFERSLSRRFTFVPNPGMEQEAQALLSEEPFEIVPSVLEGRAGFRVGESDRPGAGGSAAVEPANLPFTCAHVAEMLVAEVTVRAEGRPLERAGLTYGFDEATEERLGAILEPYDQDPVWFFDKMNFGRGPAAWALVCLPREYRLAAHVREARQGSPRIRFAPYTRVPDPLPAGFEPAVGFLVFLDREALADAALRSPLFAATWRALADRDPKRRWVVLLKEPGVQWLEGQKSGGSGLSAN